MGDRVFFGGALAGIVHAEIPAQGVAAHGPAEGLVEFGEVDGGYQGGIYRVCRVTSILQEILKMNEERGMLNDMMISLIFNPFLNKRGNKIYDKKYLGQLKRDFLKRLRLRSL